MVSNSSQIDDLIRKDLRSGRIQRIEDSSAFESDCDESRFRELLLFEIEHCVSRGEKIRETELTSRFQQRSSAVQEIFAEARDKSDAWDQFLPDPKKTQPGLLLDAFYQSTNIQLDQIGTDGYGESEVYVPSEVKLRVIRGPHSGKEQTFTDSASIIVGRGDDAQWQLSDDSRCSRMHCRFEISPPGCSVVDLKSTNGTVINGKRLPRAELKDKDTVQVGLSRIRVHVQKSSNDSVNIAPSATYNPELDMPTIPGYELSKLLGAGRFGMVYSGTRLRDGRSVAVKVLRGTANPDQNEMQDFINEAAVSVKLNHKHIVETLDFGMHDDLPYLVMENVETVELMPLMEKLPARRRQSVAMQATLQVLSGLEYAHQEGFIHRDLKISNVLCTQLKTNRFHLKISDFGLARRLESSFEGEKSICGTAAYMAPEVISDPAKIGQVSDVFSVGVCLYELLSGRRPWESNRINSLLFMIVNEPPTPINERIPSVNPRLIEVINKALSRRPDRRFQSAAEFKIALLKVAKLD